MKFDFSRKGSSRKGYKHRANRNFRAVFTTYFTWRSNVVRGVETPVEAKTTLIPQKVARVSVQHIRIFTQYPLYCNAGGANIPQDGNEVYFELRSIAIQGFLSKTMGLNTCTFFRGIIRKMMRHYFNNIHRAKRGEGQNRIDKAKTKQRFLKVFV